MRIASLVLVLVLVGNVAFAAPPAKPAPERPSVDIAAIRDKLTVWSDGKKHYVALILAEADHPPLFWSHDGQTFYQLAHSSTFAFKEGTDKALRFSFWGPRQYGYQAELVYSSAQKSMKVACASRETMLTRLPDAEAKTLLDGASFHQRLWTRDAYALARDTRGRYYYVDKDADPQTKNFRLFMGPKGALKLQKMTNIVSDAAGDIFSTPSGALRLVISNQESTWIVHEKPSKLVMVDFENSGEFIYTELGVYAGQRIGTPCDDL